MINQVKFWGHNVNEVTNKRVQKHDANTNQSFKLNIQKTTNISEETIDKISEQLEDGNFEAIEQLERAGISYTTEEKDNGYKVKFEHGDTKYTITYINNSQDKFKPQIKPELQQVNNQKYSNDLQDILSNSLSQLEEKVKEMAVPTPPMVDGYKTEEEYQNALKKYQADTEKYDKDSAEYWDIITDLRVANSISKEQERIERFDEHIKELINNVKKENSTNGKEQIQEILDYANDFKTKVNEKISCEKELNDCIDTIISLKAPNPPQVGALTLEEYEKQMEIYTKLCEQYNREKEILEKREEMLSKKLQLFESLLDGMFLYEDV